MSAVHYFACKALLLSPPFISFMSVIPFHPVVWHNNCDIPKIKHPHSTLTVALHILILLVFTNDRKKWHLILTSPGLTDVASAPIHDTIRLLVVTKCLSSLDTANQIFQSLTAPEPEPPAQRMHLARNIYIQAAACTGILAPAQCNRERRLCDNQPAEHTRRQCQCFTHITNIINMHQFPVHTEHTKISHSLNTTATIMCSSNVCSSNVLLLQKRFWMQFERAFTICPSYITITCDELSGSHRQHILAFVKHVTSDRHIWWLHSKKGKLSTSTAVLYNVTLRLCEYSRHTV